MVVPRFRGACDRGEVGYVEATEIACRYPKTSPAPGSISPCSLSAAAWANLTSIAFRVAPGNRCSGASRSISRAECIGHDQAGILRENLGRHRGMRGEEKPVARQAIIRPLLVSAEILDR